MTNTLLDISGKLDTEVLEVIDLLVSVSDALNIEIVLVGAVARDIHFLLVHGIKPGRATADVDFVLLIPSWDAFSEVMTRITRDGKCTRDSKMQHRLYSSAGIMFDLIPFGAIEDPAGKISWPPDCDHVMTTIGFQDALDSAQTCLVKNDPPQQIRVVTIAGMAVLKLIAWADGRPNRSKDAIDLRFILENYDAGQIDRLYSEEENLIDVVSTEYEMAVAVLLGRDVGRMTTPETRQAVLDILEAEQNVDGQLQLVSDMLIDSVQNANYVLGQLRHFRQGILDIGSRSIADG